MLPGVAIDVVLLGRAAHICIYIYIYILPGDAIDVVLLGRAARGVHQHHRSAPKMGHSRPNYKRSAHTPKIGHSRPNSKTVKAR